MDIDCENLADIHGGLERKLLNLFVTHVLVETGKFWVLSADFSFELHFQHLLIEHLKPFESQQALVVRTSRRVVHNAIDEQRFLSCSC